MRPRESRWAVGRISSGSRVNTAAVIPSPLTAGQQVEDSGCRAYSTAVLADYSVGSIST